jgi:hypothetical protein
MLKLIWKNKIIVSAFAVLLTIFLVAQFTGRTFCNCSTSDKFDPTKPGVHHK